MTSNNFDGPQTVAIARVPDRAMADWWAHAWGLKAQLAYAPTSRVRDAADAARWFRAGGHYHAAVRRQRAAAVRGRLQ